MLIEVDHVELRPFVGLTKRPTPPPIRAPETNKGQQALTSMNKPK